MPARRYVFLDGLRGVAALAVVAHHFSSNSGHREIFTSGPLAVDFFFCLSGFVIALSYQQRLCDGMSVAEYMRRRLIRLGPMYLIGALMGIAAAILLHLRDRTNMPSDAILLAGALNAFYIPYFNEYSIQLYAGTIRGAIFPLNNPAWSLFWEIIANIIYALDLRRLQLGPVVWIVTTAAGLCVATYFLGIAPGWGKANFLGGFPRVLFAFFTGVGLCQLRERLVRLPSVAWPLVLLAAIAMFAMPRFPGYWLACALVGVPLLVALGARCRIESGTVLHRVATYLGRISYPVYCVHYPLLMAWSVLVPIEGRLIPVAATYFVAAIFVAHLALRMIDEPVRRWLASNKAAA